MNDEVIIDYIENEIENEFIDFKLKLYEWSNTKSKGDFLVDVISLANSNVKGDKYIITGVKVKPDGERIIKGIEKEQALDSATYQELVTENIEPSLSIDFKIVDYDNKHFGVFRIYGSNDRPYLLKKKYGDYESGYIKIRRGSRNTNISRYVLDSIYKEKHASINSQFKISGIIDGEPSDIVKLYSYDFFPDFQEEKKQLELLLNKINDFKIDDIDNNSDSNPNNFWTAGLFKSEKIDIEEEVQENIKALANAIELKLNDNFFDIGNVAKRFEGFGNSGLLGPSLQYKEIGSTKSLEKYGMILKLNDNINRSIGWFAFLDEIKDYKYLQLAITEIGNISDEEIEVCIELPKDVYVDNESFPHISSLITDEVNKEYSRKMFLPEYENNISDFRRMPLSTSPHIPSTPILPLYTSNSERGYETLYSIYDYIDYDVLEKHDKTIISFTIKNLKVGETMIFPGNIILKNKIKTIEFSIISKNSKNKFMGELPVSE